MFLSEFSIEEYVENLKTAKIQNAMIYLQSHVGLCYYPTKIGIPYPGMKGDMFGDILHECHKRGIGVTAYLNGGLDEEGCRLHRDWCRVKMNRENIQDACKISWEMERRPCINSPFRDYLKALVCEVVERYPEVDGLFIDCMAPDPCYGNECMEAIRDKGGDPTDQKQVKQFARESLVQLWQELKEIAGGRRLIINSNPQWRVRNINSHIEIECLPTSGVWNYEFFPAQAAFCRKLGKEVVYMTGRFQKSWGDIGGLRTKASLENDMWDAISNAFDCSIGDHMHPAEILDEQVYGMVREIYGELEKLDPWTDGAVYQADIAVLIPELMTEKSYWWPGQFNAAARMLSELKYTYDFINETMDFSEYKLIILPDNIRFTKELSDKVSAYISGGGKILATGSSGLIQGKNEMEPTDGLKFPKEWGMTCAGLHKQTTYYYQASEETKSVFGSFRYSMYAEGICLNPPEQGKVFAWQIKPYRMESWDGFHLDGADMNERYNPPEKATGMAVAAISGSVCHISFEVFKAYSEKMYSAHRELVGYCISQLLHDPSFICKGIPVSGRVTLTKKENLRMLHVKVTYPEIRGKLGMIDDHNYLPAGACIILEGECKAVYTAPDKHPVVYEIKDGKTIISLPEIHGYCLLVIES